MFSKGPAKYNIQYGTPVKIITGLVVAFILFLVGFALYENIIEHESPVITAMEGILLPLITLYLPWIFRPQYYYLDKDVITVVRFVKNINLPYDDIVSIEKLDSKVLKGMIRLIGSGGLFGYYGLFYSGKLGKIHSYITNRDRLLLITMKNGSKHLFSPSEEGMPEHIHEMRLGR